MNFLLIKISERSPNFPIENIKTAIRKKLNVNKLENALFKSSFLPSSYISLLYS